MLIVPFCGLSGSGDSQRSAGKIQIRNSGLLTLLDLSFIINMIIPFYWQALSCFTLAIIASAWVKDPNLSLHILKSSLRSNTTWNKSNTPKKWDTRDKPNLSNSGSQVKPSPKSTQLRALAKTRHRSIWWVPPNNFRTPCLGSAGLRRPEARRHHSLWG